MLDPTPRRVAPAAPDRNTPLAPDLPADWPGLWERLIELRTHGAASGFIHDGATGWRLAQGVSAGAAALFSLYKPLLDARFRQRHEGKARAWVVAQLGQSLDGFIATSTGDSFFVNGEYCLLHLHRLRALCDAVLVGAGTVAVDNPQLTTRRVPGPHPVRVVLDPEARLDGQARVFLDGQAPTLWLCDARHAALARSRLGPALPRPTERAAPGCEVLAIDNWLVPGSEIRYRPELAIQALAERGLRLLFVEGGGITVSRFFGADALDRLHLAVAPVWIGRGRRGLQAPASEVMADCLRPLTHTVPMGPDMLWDMDLRSPAA